MQTEGHFDYLCTASYWICYNCPNYEVFRMEFGVLVPGPKSSTRLFWKPQPYALRKTPAAIPPQLEYAYNQLLVYMLCLHLY